MKKLAKILQFSLFAIVLASYPSAHATDLEDAMKNIGKNAKALKQSVGDPAKKAEAIAEIGEMIKSAEAARTMTPKKATDLSDAERAQFMSDFQKHIDGLIEQFKKIETDLTDGKTDDAKADFAKVNEMKRQGHEKFAAKD